MKCKVHVYMLNEHFSIEHANEHHNGEESELNKRYDWEDELAITSSVVDVKLIENTVFPLKGNYADGEAFNFEVKKMLLYQIISDDAPEVLVGASHSIIERHELEKIEHEFIIRIFIRDYEPLSNPIPGIYIAAQEFPKELIH